MLTEQTLNKLEALRLYGMAENYRQQRQNPAALELTFDERFGSLVESEWMKRTNRAMQLRLTKARLKQNACLEDIDWAAARGLHREVITHLSLGDSDVLISLENRLAWLGLIRGNQQA